MIRNTFVHTDLMPNFKFKRFIIMNLNINSLGAKRDLLLAYLDKLKDKNIYVLAICIQEVWTYNKTLEIPGYTFHHNTRHSVKGGGVGIFVCQSLSSKKIIDFMSIGTLELVAISITTPSNKKLNIINCYHTPDGSTKVSTLEHFENFKHHFLQQIKLINTKICSLIVGDFNTCIKNHRYRDEFLDLMYTSGFFLCNTLASRITSFDSFSFIDNIFCNHVSLIKQISTSIDKISDHNTIYITLNTEFFGKISEKGPARVKYRDFGEKNLEKFRVKIERIDWNEVLLEEDVGRAFDKFYYIFLNTFNDHFKEKYKNINIRNTSLNPWFSAKMRRKRNILENLKLHARRNPLLKPSVNRAKNRYNKEIEKAKKEYYVNKLDSCEGNSKKIWQCLNSVWSPGGGKGDNKIEALRDEDGVVVSDLEGMASIFNRYYNTFTNKLSESMPNPPTGDFKDFLGQPANSTFYLGGVTPDLIIKTLTGMAPKKSVDINGISMNILKKCKSELSIVLANLFTKSLRSGVVPSQMKLSKIVPIFKKGDPLDCANYRGICLIENCGKILEKIVQTRLYGYLEKNNLIYKNQYGFRRRTGTDHCVLNIVNEISKSFNDGQMSSVLSLDVQKAFDIINWDILFYKLNHYGVKNGALRWFQSYFSNRTSQVSVNGVLGTTICSLLRGVCQGSCLGPLLFLIYINDLPNCLTGTSVSVLFADDNQVVNKASDIGTLSDKINLDIKTLVNWYCLNKLPIHPGKTSLTFFSPNKLVNNFRIPVDGTGKCTLSIITDFNFDSDNYDGSRCYPVHITNLNSENDGGVKILGIVLDPHLNFKHQSKLTSAKVKSSIFALKRSSNFLKLPELLKLFHAFVRSHLNYIIPFINICNKDTFHSLNMVDRAAARAVFGVGMSDPISHKYKEHKIPTLEDLYKIYVGKFMHKLDHNNLKGSFKEFWPRVGERVGRENLRTLGDFDTPAFIKYIHLKNFPLFSFPDIYNRLPQALKTIAKPKTFANTYKKFIISGGDETEAIELTDDVLIN